MRGIAQKQLVHSVRIGILICIVVLIRLQQREILSAASNAPFDDISAVLPFFPAAKSLGVNDGGRTDVLGADAEQLGYVLQTSPDCDDIVGFSGPTNMLIAFSPDETIIGIRVVSSGDTRDHIRQVVNDDRFMKSLNSLTVAQAKNYQYDAVSGATLTSLAIRESISRRLGNRETKSLRFPDPPVVATVKTLFPECDRIEKLPATPVDRIFDSSGIELGSVLRTSPAADNTIGYQGPTEALIGFNNDGRVIGVAVGNSFDNEPYVGYVRDDSYFLSLFNDLDLGGLTEFDVAENQVEGVSGATMTSMTVAEGIVLAAKKRESVLKATTDAGLARSFGRWTMHDIGTMLCVVVGSLIGLTRLRGNKHVNLLWNVLLVSYVGLVAGSLLSQAMFVGWAANGIPIGSGFGLILLTVAAVSLPIATRRNVYCTHLCPHGAAQQLLKNRLPWRWRLSSQARAVLRLLPGMLLLWCVIIGMTSFGFSLVDIEPFDAYVFRIAGVATIIVAVVGLIASLFVPMAYCRFGCPTGALLGYLRFNARSDQWSIRDWVATCYLIVAFVLFIAH